MGFPPLSKDAATANLVGLFEGTNLCAIDDDREPKGGSGSRNYLSAQHSDVGREVSYLHGTRTQHEDRGFTKITSTFRSDLWLSMIFLLTHKLIYIGYRIEQELGTKIKEIPPHID
ncbi:hypothetical protein JHK82_035544 [Glycine max]|nr:hypothetical protein JHK85_036266 [Glycine max]KAG4976199.1 hypothetical protein JHK86_035673 [Glycine max]KAG5112275.1 hypothetical protein JHK82_035544 [Glycine max]KAG5129553.1 hypothetical protein JHK84_035950 [Glycine max]